MRRTAKAIAIPAGLAAIESLTEQYATARERLSDRVSMLDTDLTIIKRQQLPGIKLAAASAKDARAALEEAINANKAEFEKPRTRTFHGIKVGLRKLIGSITWESADQVVKLIRKHFPDQADVLIRTEEKPVVAAISQLPVADLKRIGCGVEDDTDVPVIKASDGDIEKLVDALLKDTKEAE